MTVAICIPTIPPRAGVCERAFQSVVAQTWPGAYVVRKMDSKRRGASATRNIALRAALDDVCTDDDGNFEGDAWIGFLDDDDELLPHHVKTLIDAATAADVGVAWGWYDVVGGGDPLPAEFRGRTYDPDAPHCVPITYMAKASLLRAALDEMGGFIETLPNTGYWSQDEAVLSFIVRRGGHIALPETTWLWHHDTPRREHERKAGPLVNGLAVIPTIFGSPYLVPLVDTLRAEDIKVVCVCNKPNYSRRRWEPMGMLPCVLDRPGWGIYRTWNFGLRLGAHLNVPTLILNDDIVLAPKAATEMCRTLEHTALWSILGFDYNPGDAQYDAEGECVATPEFTHGTYRHGGIGGFAFGCNPRRCARIDRRFMWWGGDDDLVLGTEALGHRVGILRGAKVQHPQPSLTANSHPELLPEGWAANDYALLVEKYGAGW